jgi:hypothetical protein
MSNQNTQAVSSVSWAGWLSGVVAPQALTDDWSPAPDAQATDFTEEDEAQLKQLARLTAATLGALRRLHENSAPGQQ